MNRIDVIEATIKYVPEPHKVLTLDGVPLDVLLDSVRPNHNLLGLVPTRLPLGFDHADMALASRAHTVGGFETLGPPYTQRDHRGRVDRHPEARGQALSAKVARMLLEEPDHGFAEI